MQILYLVSKILMKHKIYNFVLLNTLHTSSLSTFLIIEVNILGFYAVVINNVVRDIISLGCHVEKIC